MPSSLFFSNSENWPKFGPEFEVYDESIDLSTPGNPRAELIKSRGQSRGCEIQSKKFVKFMMWHHRTEDVSPQVDQLMN